MCSFSPSLAPRALRFCRVCVCVWLRVHVSVLLWTERQRDRRVRRDEHNFPAFFYQTESDVPSSGASLSTFSPQKASLAKAGGGESFRTNFAPLLDRVVARRRLHTPAGASNQERQKNKSTTTMAAVLAARMPSAVVARRSTGPNNAPGTMRASSRVNNGSNNNRNSNSGTRRRMTATPQQRSGVIGSHRRRVGGATAPAAARGPIVNFFNVFGGSTKEKEKQEMKDGEEEDGETTTEKITTAEEEKKSVSYDLLDLKNGAEGSVQAAADVFERVDDVVMGGVSSSAIGPDLAGRDCLVWAGKCRVQGGGFTGKATSGRRESSSFLFLFPKVYTGVVTPSRGVVF